MYVYAERAANKIQLAFRERQEAKLDAEKTDSSTEDDDTSAQLWIKSIENNEKDASDKNTGQWYTWFFLVGALICSFIPKLIMMCSKYCGGDDAGAGDAADAAATAAMQSRQATTVGGEVGGGGAGGPAPSGGEGGAGAGGAGGAQAGAQGAMAAQAASSAASGAASGVASGAAAGKFCTMVL